MSRFQYNGADANAVNEWSDLRDLNPRHLA
jgi:hypothetical protein